MVNVNVGIVNIPYMDVSENRDTPKSSILIRFSIIYHPFWGTLIFGNTHMEHMGMIAWIWKGKGVTIRDTEWAEVSLST